MKKRLIVGIMALLPLAAIGQERIMVIADPHVLAQSLVEPGEAFDELMNGQRKMLDLSEQAWLALMDTALKYKPELVLVPGDLTKDGELESHAIVVQSLRQLHEAGIQTLVIPGNHDIGGKAYSYKGDQKTPVETLTDEQWETTYPWVYEGAVAKDKGSHSYAAEPLEGLTVLGIDGSHNDAGTGELSEETLAFLLAQADSAVAKRNTVIAMSHWQILEHFDQQGTLESACRFKRADDLRDSLMAHGVHLVLTGHFHVNGITTYHASSALDADSLVEITTGSPITYPCPYRWLTLSEDRTAVRVETDDLASLDTIPDMHTYSREWMYEHATNMIPQMTLRVWRKAENNKDKVEKAIGKTATDLLWQCFPETDSAKIALVQKHLGSTVVELYLLHSDANEPEYPQADSLAQEVYRGMEAMIHEMTDEKMNNIVFQPLQKTIISIAHGMIEEPVQSMVEDVTQWAWQDIADRTDDLRLTLKINTRQADQAVETIREEGTSENRKMIQDGTLIIRNNERKYDVSGRAIQ